MFTCNLSEREGFTSQERHAFFLGDSVCCVWWELAGMGCKGLCFFEWQWARGVTCGSCIAEVTWVNTNFCQILLLLPQLFKIPLWGCDLLVMPKSRGAHHLLSAGLAVPNISSLPERKESSSWGQGLLPFLPAVLQLLCMQLFLLSSGDVQKQCILCKELVIFASPST